jgi:hypothetical protein
MTGLDRADAADAVELAMKSDGREGSIISTPPSTCGPNIST